MWTESREKQPPLKSPLKDKYERRWLEMYLLSASCEMFRHPLTGTHTPVRIGYKIRVITLSRKLYSRDVFDDFKQATKNRENVFHVASYSV